MPNNDVNEWWNQDFATATSTTGDSVHTPFPKPELKPRAAKAMLNICDGIGHNAYTIPIGYGVAQCLVCNMTKRVGVEYTPRFAEKRSLSALEQPLTTEQEAEEFYDPPDGGDFEDDEGDHEEPYEEDQP